MSLRTTLAAAAAACLLLACTSRPIDHDAGTSTHGVGSACMTASDCRAGLTCASDRTCQPSPTTPAGMPCTLTAECMPGLYCSAAGACAQAGDTPVGGTCGDTSSCVAGAVCFRAAPGLYGTCELPRGATLPDGGAGGNVGDAGAGRAGDVGAVCTDLLDCLAGLACTTTGSPHTCQRGVPGMGLPAVWPGVSCESTTPGDGGAGTVTAYFELPGADGTPRHDFFRLPFPNDVRRDSSTGRINLTGFPTPGAGVLGVDLVDRYARASEQALDGFGTNQIVYFRFSGAIDFNTLCLQTMSGRCAGAAAPSLQLLDLTTGHPTNAIRYNATTGGNRYICPNYVAVDTSPGAPMQPGHTYAAVLTTSLRDTSDRPVARDADFGPMLAATAPADPVAARAWAAYAPLRTYLATHMVSPDTILNAAVFTTQLQPLRVVPALREVVRGQPAPAASGFVRCAPGVRSPCDDGLTGADHVRGCPDAQDPAFDELQGRIELPVFQSGGRPYRMTGEGEIPLDATGRPTVQRREAVCVTVTVPRGGAMPAGGWPAVLYAHGTGGNFRSGVTEGLAAQLASVDLGGGSTARFALVGYEGVMHGERRGTGVTESPDTLFFNFANPGAARDNVLQGAADVFALVYALENVALAMLPDPASTVRFDPARLFFLGHSQGGTVGLPAVAFEPDVHAVVFSGTGGDLRASLTTKRHPVDIAALTPVVLQDPDATNASHPALQLFQAYFERADAVNYAPRVLGDLPTGVPLRPVVMTYGLGDTFSTPDTMQTVASAMGLPAAAPIPGGMMAWPPGAGVPLPAMNNLNTAAGRTTAVLLEVDPMGAYDGHYVLFRDAALGQRVMRFLGSAATGVAVVQ